jgi:hypothetical protein
MQFLAKFGPNRGANNGHFTTGRKGQYAGVPTRPAAEQFAAADTPQEHRPDAAPEHAGVDAPYGFNIGRFSTTVLRRSKGTDLPYFASQIGVDHERNGISL